MAQFKLTKPQKQLVAILEKEGGTVVDVRKGGNHLKIDYTFDHRHFFTTHLPYGFGMSPRWEMNFRADIRKQKRSLSENNHAPN